MTSYRFLPNSPTLMNAGTDLGQLAACFVLPVGDSMEEIFDAVKNAALIHKSGGGTGFSFSRLRPKDSRVGSTGGVASGPLSFLRIFNTATEQVKQGGTRRGANMGILRVDHPDILEFIRAKERDGELNNFNLSVALTERFMQAVEKDEEYALIAPHTGKESGRLKAREVFSLLVRKAWESGDPGIIFLDRINRDNPTPDQGEIESTNPCVTGDAFVMTSNGPRQVHDLLGEQTELLVNGQRYATAPEGFFSTGKKQVYRLCTREGLELRLTGDHKVLRVEKNSDGQFVTGWIEAQDLLVGNLIALHDHSEECVWCEADMACKVYQFSPNRERFLGTFESLEPAGEEEVFDVQVPGVNAFDANGFYVHNCGEQPLLPYEACNLGSINLARVAIPGNDDGLDWEELKRIIHLSVRFLDNVIDASVYPLDRITETVRRNRKIGLGIMGWADLLYQLRIPYDSQKAIRLGEQVMDFIQKEARSASKKLAVERGPFPAYETSVFRDQNLGPYRNATTTTIAPTGTLSIIAGCSSGIEPLFALSFARQVMDGERLVESNPYFEQALHEAGAYSHRLMEKVTEIGSVRAMEEVPEEIRRVFATAMDIDPVWHLRMQAAFQKFTDNAVSKTVNLPHQATQEDIRSIYWMAYEQGCKGVTVYRDGCKAVQVLYSGQSQEKQEQQDNGSTRVMDRPEIMYGFTQKVSTGLGDLYLTVNEIDGRPFEVFTTIGRSGRSITAKAEAIGRLVSLALRSGIHVREVVKQLKGIGGEHPVFRKKGMLLSIPDAVGWVLENRYLQEENVPHPGTSLSQPRCPDCGQELVFQEGCFLCPGCGYTRCG
jgi:ribonucleotide reductase alpha subunit